MNKKKLYILRILSIFFITVISVSATITPSEEWNKTYDQAGIVSVSQTSDGGYIFLSNQYQCQGSENATSHVVKTDNNGNKEWDKILSCDKYLESINQTSDGGYILIGRSYIYPIGDQEISNAYIIKLNKDGDKEWDNEFGDTMTNEYGISVQQIDGGYIVLYNDGTFNFLRKIDNYGNLQWNKKLNEMYSSYKVIPTPNGYIIYGTKLKETTTGILKPSFIIQTDNTGNELWNRTFDLDCGGLGDMVQSEDRGYVFISDHTNPDHENLMSTWAIKIDNNGDERWRRFYSNDTYSLQYTKIQRSNNGYVLFGVENGKPIMTEFDKNGYESWEILPTIDWPYYWSGGFNSGQQTTDGGYIAGGNLNLWKSGNGSVEYLIKFNSNIDDMPPHVIITAPIEGFHYNSSTLPELSYSVSDNIDHLPTISVIDWSIDEGIHKTTVNATDSTGNIGSASVTYTVDNTPPVIHINGDNPINIYIGEAYTDTGAIAIDNYDGSVPVISTGSVDSNTVGEYIITYTSNDNAGNYISAIRTVNVIYNFTGFFQPVDNLPIWNAIKAGSAIPVRFSLNGNQGLDIFAAGPVSQNIVCDSSKPIDPVEETVTADSSGLSYNPTIDQYSYVWKTNKNWNKGCRQLIVLLKDGTYRNASFNVK